MRSAKRGALRKKARSPYDAAEGGRQRGTPQTGRGGAHARPHASNLRAKVRAVDPVFLPSLRRRPPSGIYRP
eukprot:7919192-Pyramimonas_sp.AAC.1